MGEVQEHKRCSLDQLKLHHVALKRTRCSCIARAAAPDIVDDCQSPICGAIALSHDIWFFQNANVHPKKLSQQELLYKLFVVLKWFSVKFDSTLDLLVFGKLPLEVELCQVLAYKLVDFAHFACNSVTQE